MTKIVAVDYDAGKALFETEDKAVIVDINKRDVDQVCEMSQALTASAWMKVASDFEHPGVWDELAEAAVATLGVKEAEAAPTSERKFRVPQAVKDEAQRGIEWSTGFDRGHSAVGLSIARQLTRDSQVSFSKMQRIARYFSNKPKSITENAGWSPGEQGFPTNDRIKYSLWGGEAAREWVAKVEKNHPLLASGPKSKTDNSQNAEGDRPHPYVEDADLPGQCVTCGRPEDAPIHQGIIASAFDYDEACDYFGHGIDPDETLVDALYMRRPDGSWAKRENNDWQDMDEPAEDDIVILLDKESAYHLADIIDDKASEDPSVLPFELAMINPHEAALANAAYAEIDWDLVDRVFDIYDSQERAINAKKQVRGPGGRFGDMPDDEDSKKQDEEKVTKARLPEPLPLVDDVNMLISRYVADVAQKRNADVNPVEEGEDTAEDGPVTASGGNLSAEYVNSLIERYGNTRLGRQELAENDPETVTDVRPLYLAIVDEVDTEAVLDVISLVPHEGDVVVWRRHAGSWEPAQEILADLRGVTPPPVVELSNDAILQSVLEQVDKTTSGDSPNQEQPAPGETPVENDGSSGEKPDANPDQHPITASAYELAGDDKKSREKQAKKGVALPDGSFPIPDVEHLKKAVKAYGRAKNKTAAKKHIIKRARALGRTDLLPNDWDKNMSTDSFAMWGPNGEIMQLAEGGADRNRGGAEHLRRYWTKGEGAAKIMWNTPGDWYRCVAQLSKYLGPRAKGYCTLRHKEATGHWPGQEDND